MLPTRFEIIVFIVASLVGGLITAIVYLTSLFDVYYAGAVWISIIILTLGWKLKRDVDGVNMLAMVPKFFRNTECASKTFGINAEIIKTQYGYDVYSSNVQIGIVMFSDPDVNHPFLAGFFKKDGITMYRYGTDMVRVDIDHFSDTSVGIFSPEVIGARFLGNIVYGRDGKTEILGTKSSPVTETLIVLAAALHLVHFSYLH
jgi:hypothetical protein